MSGRRLPEYATLPPLSRGEILERRSELGMSQQQLADALGIDRKTLSRWETGDRTPLSLVRLALERIAETREKE